MVGSEQHLELWSSAIMASSARRVFIGYLYGWMPHNASFGFLDLTPSILLLRQFWD
jgi:hypothetical protein